MVKVRVYNYIQVYRRRRKEYVISVKIATISAKVYGKIRNR